MRETTHETRVRNLVSAVRNPRRGVRHMKAFNLRGFATFSHCLTL